MRIYAPSTRTFENKSGAVVRKQIKLFLVQANDAHRSTNGGLFALTMAVITFFFNIIKQELAATKARYQCAKVIIRSAS